MTVCQLPKAYSGLLSNKGEPWFVRCCYKIKENLEIKYERTTIRIPDYTCSCYRAD